MFITFGVMNYTDKADDAKNLELTLIIAAMDNLHTVVCMIKFVDKLYMYWFNCKIFKLCKSAESDVVSCMLSGFPHQVISPGIDLSEHSFI